MIAVIAMNEAQARNFANQFNLHREDWRYIMSPDQLRGLHPDANIVLLPDWWYRKDKAELQELVEYHDQKYKKKVRDL